MTCPLTEVNQARQQIFARSSRTFEFLPPTKAALIEHIKRTTYHTRYVWGQSLIAEQVLPSPDSWGWAMSEFGWVLFWTPLSQASEALEELVSCSCTKSCVGRCSCFKKGLCAQPDANVEEVVTVGQVVPRSKLPNKTRHLLL